MQKSKSSLYVIGCLLIGVTVLLLLYLTLIFTGVIDMRENRLVIQAGSAEKEYDGSPLSCNEWELTEGKLRMGHRLIVTVKGELTAVGSAPNQVFAQVLDASGNDVTDDYALELRQGTLSVLGIRLVLRSASASRTYNGETLTAGDWEFVSGRFLSGHSLGPVTVSGSITEVGETPNTISATVVDTRGNDVSQNYELIYETGTLKIAPIALTISTGTMEWVYTGEEFSHESYTLATGTLFGGDNLNVEFVRSCREIGKVANEVRITVTDRDGNDVTSRYDIELILGHLAVFSEFGDSDDIDGDGWKDLFQDFDGDGIPDHWLDTDGDGKPDTAPNSPGLMDSDGNGVLDMYEDRDGNGIFDMLEDANGDGIPDWWPDGNGDGKPDMPGIFTNLDSSGKIANDDATREDTANNDTMAVMLQSDYSGDIYMRHLSYGNYDPSTGSWKQATPYDYAAYGFNPIYLSAMTLLDAGYRNQTVSVVLNGKQHLEPYYTTTPTAEGTDVFWPLSGDDPYRYTLSYIPFYNVSNAQSLLSGALRAEYRELETAYRAFVKANYKSVPAETEAALRALAAEHDLYAGRPDLIEAVAQAIRGCATYDMEATDPEGEYDIVSYFLTESKTGVCRHFASAATLLYRYLDIPARYVGGYMGKTVAGQTVALTGANAHAWVEIYLDGIGWMPVEVTPPSTDGDTDGDDDEPELPEPEVDYSKPGQILSSDPNARTLKIRPISQSKPYDGTPLTCPETGTGAVEILADLGSDVPRSGHTVHIETSGEQTNVGTCNNWIKRVWVTDSAGNDVTGQYNIYYNIEDVEPATLTVSAISLTFTSGSSTVHMSETTRLTNENVSISGSLLPQHRVEFTVTGVQEGVGMSKNTFTYTIYETVGDESYPLTEQEIKKYYKITPKIGTLKIHCGVITVTVNGGTQMYDGTPLVAELSIDDSALNKAENHNVLMTGTISQTEPGTTNVVTYLSGQQGKSATRIVKILSPNGDVTDQYDVQFVAGKAEGKLTIQVRPLKVTVIGNSAIFDLSNPGMKIEPQGVTVTDDSNLLDGHEIVKESLKATGEQVGLGESPAKLGSGWKIIDTKNNNRDVTKYYTMIVTEGKLEITAR